MKIAITLLFVFSATACFAQTLKTGIVGRPISDIKEIREAYETAIPGYKMYRADTGHCSIVYNYTNGQKEITAHYSFDNNVAKIDWTKAIKWMEIDADTEAVVAIYKRLLQDEDTHSPLSRSYGHADYGDLHGWYVLAPLPPKPGYWRFELKQIR